MADPLDFLEPEELLRFFHCNKTQLSLLEKPHTFLNQLRDYNFVPEDKYKKVSCMRSRDNIKKGLYDILDWVERNRSQNIKLFWGCVFKDAIMNQYHTLKTLHKSLIDGSFHFDTMMPEGAGMDEEDNSENEQIPEDKERKTNAIKKRKRKSERTCEAEEEQPGPSSQITPVKKKKTAKLFFSSPLKNGEKGDIWTWPLYRLQLPVTCGKIVGTLKRDRFARGEKCILADKKWFTPIEFEKFGGKASSKNWKLSIQCQGTTLAELIKEGHLPPAKFKRGTKNASTNAKKTLNLSVHLMLDSDQEESDDAENNDEDEESTDEDERSGSSDNGLPEVTDEEEEMEEEAAQPSRSTCVGGKTVFKVTCGDMAATMHQKRFASGTVGRSIRTETSWMSPVDFAKEALNWEYVSWKKDIISEGKPLFTLLEEEILKIHPQQCGCRLCHPESGDEDNQKNDDECCICKDAGEKVLVVCDYCPRSFHQECHLPHIEGNLLRDDSLWMCTFCIFKSILPCHYEDRLERETVLSYQIHDHILDCHYLVLFLCSVDEEQFFSTNPSHYVKNYSSSVKTPMWLSEVAGKLQRKQYQTVGQFVSDVQLIFTNCAQFNQNNAEFLANGEKLKQLFEREFTNAFNIDG